jgi:hypothetical protein
MLVMLCYIKPKMTLPCANMVVKVHRHKASPASGLNHRGNHSANNQHKPAESPPSHEKAQKL